MTVMPLLDSGFLMVGAGACELAAAALGADENAGNVALGELVAPIMGAPNPPPVGLKSGPTGADDGLMCDCQPQTRRDKTAGRRTHGKNQAAKVRYTTK